MQRAWRSRRADRWVETEAVRCPASRRRAPADGTGGPEDGNGLGIHGAGGGDADKPDVTPAVTDLEIALAVATKSRTLVNRMVAREQTVAEQYSKAGMESNDPGLAPARALIMQLVAVISLLREIKRLENGLRWSGKGLKLLDPKSLLHLFENSMTYLFRADFDVAHRARSGEAVYAEVEQLFGLMAWLSWVCPGESGQQERKQGNK